MTTMKPRMIVVEGPTGCGKTTLIEGLLKEGLATHVYHMPRPPAEIIRSPWQMETHYAAPTRDTGDVLLDRWVYSNMAYSAVFGNQARCAPWNLERWAEDGHRVLVVFLTADPSELFLRIRRRGEARLPEGVEKIENLTKLVAEYGDIEANCALPKVGCRTDGDSSPQATLAAVLKRLRAN